MVETSPSARSTAAPPPPKEWKFAELLADERVRARWQKVRRFFFLRESTYDITSRCNIRCDGCYYYVGEKQHARDNREPEAWRALMRGEKARGITFAVLAGAEPSLEPDLCRICAGAVSLGAVATNGLRRIPPDIGYKIHISVWGDDETSRRTRQAEGMLRRQMDNYRDDPRAIFVYTFTRHNIEEAPQVGDALGQAFGGYGDVLDERQWLSPPRSPLHQRYSGLAYLPKELGVGLSLRAHQMG